MAEVKSASKDGDSNGDQSDQVNKEVLEVAQREALKTENDVYEEVFIDEVNQEILKNVIKQDGEVIVVLMRQERLKKFAEVWRQANLDFYNTQTAQDRQLRKSKASIVDDSDQALAEQAPEVGMSAT